MPGIFGRRTTGIWREIGHWPPGISIERNSTTTLSGRLIYLRRKQPLQHPWEKYSPERSGHHAGLPFKKHCWLFNGLFTWHQISTQIGGHSRIRSRPSGIHFGWCHIFLQSSSIRGYIQCIPLDKAGKLHIAMHPLSAVVVARWIFIRWWLLFHFPRESRLGDGQSMLHTGPGPQHPHFMAQNWIWTPRSMDWMAISCYCRIY